MKQPPKLVVAPFENRNGVTSYRVTGWVNDERVRKNFKTRAEADAEKTALEIGAVQAADGMQMVATPLTIEQVRVAEVCFRRHDASEEEAGRVTALLARDVPRECLRTRRVQYKKFDPLCWPVGSIGQICQWRTPAPERKSMNARAPQPRLPIP